MNTKKIFLQNLFIFTLSLAACVAGSSIAAHANVMTCRQGKNSCGFRFPIFLKGASFAENQFQFLDNTNYQDFWDDRYDQINKLFGATDCGEIFSARVNSALVGWRHIKGTNNIEITGYVHRSNIMQNGVNFRHAPIGIIPRSLASSARVETLGHYYLYNLNSKNLLLMARGCSDQSLRGRHVNPWFGGQRSAPRTLSIDLNHTNSLQPQFPLTLRIADQDQMCKIGNPENYLVQHDSGLMGLLRRYCSKTVKIRYLNCNNYVSDSSGSGWNSPESIASLNYSLQCE